MGYGSRALQALGSFYSGECVSLDEPSTQEALHPDPAAIEPVRIFPDLVLIPTRAEMPNQGADLLSELPQVRSVSSMPPLLQRLTQRQPESLDYLGVSYGLTPQLLR